MLIFLALQVIQELSETTLSEKSAGSGEREHLASEEKLFRSITRILGENVCKIKKSPRLINGREPSEEKD